MSYYHAKRTALAKMYLEQREAQDRIKPPSSRLEEGRAWLATYQRPPSRFNVIFRFGITPLFLFSGTFFPIESLPAPLQSVAWLSPLWHGVDLSRGVVLGTIGERPLVMLAHVVVLAAIVVVGSWATARLIEKRLVQG